MSLHPLLFRDTITPMEAGAPIAGRVLAGDPTFGLRNHYTDASGQFFSGEWSSSVGKWRVAYGPQEEEFCLLVEGEVRLTSSDGTVSELRAGDAFMIPGGFQGTWESITPVRKLYALMDLRSTST